MDFLLMTLGGAGRLASAILDVPTSAVNNDRRFVDTGRLRSAQHPRPDAGFAKGRPQTIAAGRAIDRCAARPQNGHARHARDIDPRSAGPASRAAFPICKG